MSRACIRICCVFLGLAGLTAGCANAPVHVQSANALVVDVYESNKQLRDRLKSEASTQDAKFAKDIIDVLVAQALESLKEQGQRVFPSLFKNEREGGPRLPVSVVSPNTHQGETQEAPGIWLVDIQPGTAKRVGDEVASSLQESMQKLGALDFGVGGSHTLDLCLETLPDFNLTLKSPELVAAVEKLVASKSTPLWTAEGVQQALDINRPPGSGLLAVIFFVMLVSVSIGGGLRYLQAVSLTWNANGSTRVSAGTLLVIEVCVLTLVGAGWGIANRIANYEAWTLALNDLRECGACGYCEGTTEQSCDGPAIALMPGARLWRSVSQTKVDACKDSYLDVLGPLYERGALCVIAVGVVFYLARCVRRSAAGAIWVRDRYFGGSLAVFLLAVVLSVLLSCYSCGRS